MTTITDKKQYPGEQYLNELITNIEFAARAPVEVVRAMAAELQKRREADGAEPVAWVMADDLRDNAIVSTPAYPCLDDAKERTIGSLIALYAAPPVPVIPAALPENDDEDGHDIDYLEPSEVYSLGRTAGWNACRAAMLHGAEPVSNHEELPLDYLQGQKDGLEWAAQLAEANHPQTGDWLYDDPLELAKAIRKGPDMPEFDGPTPVTPDGWVIVPKELTPEMMRAVQIRSELGGYATSNLSGAYNMFSEFWNVAVSAAPKVDDL